MVYTGHIRQGLVVLDEAVVLPEGAPVRVWGAGNGTPF